MTIKHLLTAFTASLAVVSMAVPVTADVEARSKKKSKKAKSDKGKKARGGSAGGSAYYSSCAKARAVGVAPLRRGDRGYSRNLDRDGDGIACE
jgi:Excalibur calcium-binding domain